MLRLFRNLFLALALVSFVGGTIANTAMAGAGCEIRTSQIGAEVRLDAVIKATGPIAGNYRFEIHGGGKAEPKVSEGKFEVTAPGPSEIQKASVELEAGKAYSASLEINWPGGMSSCSAGGS